MGGADERASGIVVEPNVVGRIVDCGSFQDQDHDQNRRQG
jgi:hypothetical protein